MTAPKPENERKWSVVIDPDDRERIERLHSLQYLAVEKIREQQGGGGVSLIDALQQAFRWLDDPDAKLPKPTEPVGAAALIEDRDGAIWARQCTRTSEKDMTRPWLHLVNGCVPGPADRERAYSDIEVVRILSDGEPR